MGEVATLVAHPRLPPPPEKYGLQVRTRTKVPIPCPAIFAQMLRYRNFSSTVHVLDVGCVGEGREEEEEFLAFDL